MAHRYDAYPVVDAGVPLGLPDCGLYLDGEGRCWEYGTQRNGQRGRKRCAKHDPPPGLRGDLGKAAEASAVGMRECAEKTRCTRYIPAGATCSFCGPGPGVHRMLCNDVNTIWNPKGPPRCACAVAASDAFADMVEGLRDKHGHTIRKVR